MEGRDKEMATEVKVKENEENKNHLPDENIHIKFSSRKRHLLPKKQTFLHYLG